MSKSILAIHYSQSGQLSKIMERFCAPMEAAGHKVEHVRIELADQELFAFPWNQERFFSVMPDSVLGRPTELKPFSFKQEKYDLVILGYQPWYLSPSIPTTSILKDERLKTILKGANVVTVIGARNMWLNAQEKIKSLLTEARANLVGNVALVDHNPNLISAITIQYWMFTGRKDEWLGIFPKPGISEHTINGSVLFGEILSRNLENVDLQNLQAELVEHKAVEVQTNLMFIEGRAGRLFQLWATFISKRKNKKAWLKVFKYYLLVALFIIAPPILLINMLLFRPLLGKQIARKKRYYLGEA